MKSEKRGWDSFHEAMLQLPPNRELRKEDLLTDDFLIARQGRWSMYYAPHNEYVNTAARVVIIGLTPGWMQMKAAFETARRCLEQGLTREETWRRAKEEARFAGSMRRHLIGMLDALELPGLLGAASGSSLFGADSRLLHTTSLLRYPVFIGESNYSGAHPALLTTPSLLETAFDTVRDELSLFRNVLFIPLGKTVEAVLRMLEREGRLEAPDNYLWGFPHPSGANGHRHRQFAERFGAMRQTAAAVLGGGK